MAENAVALADHGTMNDDSGGLLAHQHQPQQQQQSYSQHTPSLVSQHLVSMNNFHPLRKEHMMLLLIID